MELTLAARLGALIAEHRARIPELLSALAEQTMLDGRSHHRRRALRSQRAGALPAIEKAVHLLADDIGGLTDTPTEQIRAFQQRCSNLTEAGTLKTASSHSFHRLPALQGGRKQVNHASQALQLGHNTRSKPSQSAVTRRRCRWRPDPSAPAGD